MKTVYISIPMTGKDESVQRRKAKRLEKMLISDGFKVLNPFDLSDNMDYQWNVILKKEPDYKAYLLHDIYQIAMRCDIICMVNDWYLSKGCMAELRFGEAIGLKVMCATI